MGRELKRVPLDFKWPINQIWKGFVNPFHGQKCTQCDGSGQNAATKKLSDDWYSFDNAHYINVNQNKRYNDNAWQYHLTEIEVEALTKAGRLCDLTPYSLYFDKDLDRWFGWIDGVKQEVPQPEYPTPEAVNNWAINAPMGHDGANHYICVKARAKHLGIFGDCEVCGGEGDIWFSDEVKKMSEDWQGYEPPTGEGFQLWTTTNEGAPISPVFETLELLCEYCEDNCTAFGHSKTTKEGWFDMLNDGIVTHRSGNMIFI